CNPVASADAVFEFTLSTTQDVSVDVVPSTIPPPVPGMVPRTQAAVALVSDCGETAMATQCSGPGSTAVVETPSLRVRNLTPGPYRLVAETGPTPGPFRLTLRYAPPTITPPIDTCPLVPTGPAVDLNDGAPHAARLSELRDDYRVSCSGSPGRPDAVF